MVQALPFFTVSDMRKASSICSVFSTSTSATSILDSLGTVYCAGHSCTGVPIA